MCENCKNCGHPLYLMDWGDGRTDWMHLMPNEKPAMRIMNDCLHEGCHCTNPEPLLKKKERGGVE